MGEHHISAGENPKKRQKEYLLPANPPNTADSFPKKGPTQEKRALEPRGTQKGPNPRNFLKKGRALNDTLNNLREWKTPILTPIFQPNSKGTKNPSVQEYKVLTYEKGIPLLAFTLGMRPQT